MGRALTSVTTKANARALAHAAWVVGMACCTLLLRGCKPPAAPPLLASSCARDPVLELLLFGPEGGWVAQVGKCRWAAGWGGGHGEGGGPGGRRAWCQGGGSMQLSKAHCTVPALWQRRVLQVANTRASRLRVIDEQPA